MDAKVFKRGAITIERQPHNPEFAPRISLLIQSPGPQLDQHIGREHECYQRIALLSQRIPAKIIIQDCKTETMDLVVQAMLGLTR